MKLLPTDQNKVIYFGKENGPAFGRNSLTIGNTERMNKVNWCNCHTKGHCEYFNVPEDDLGNSILTGDGQGKEAKVFTLAALETWVVTY